MPVYDNFVLVCQQYQLILDSFITSIVKEPVNALISSWTKESTKFSSVTCRLLTLLLIKTCQIKWNYYMSITIVGTLTGRTSYILLNPYISWGISFQEFLGKSVFVDFLGNQFSWISMNIIFRGFYETLIFLGITRR